MRMRYLYWFNYLCSIVLQFIRIWYILKHNQRKIKILKNGVYFDIASDKLENTDKLKHKITQLREKVDAITQELEAIKADETFNTIQAIEDWDAYFVQMRDALEQEYQELLENEKSREAEVDEDEKYWDELF